MSKSNAEFLRDRIINMRIALTKIAQLDNRLSIATAVRIASNALDWHKAEFRDIVSRRQYQADLIDAQSRDASRWGEWNVPQILREDADEITRLRGIIDNVRSIVDDNIFSLADASKAVDEIRQAVL